MRPSQNNNGNGHRRMRGRGNNGRGGKGPNPLTRSYESNGPDNIKVRGTAQHVADKYSQLARDAQASGDPVAAENYFQHAEHYYRLIAEAQIQQYGEIQRPASDDEESYGGQIERNAFDPRSNEEAYDYGSQPQPYAARGEAASQERGPYEPRERQDRFPRRDRFERNGERRERMEGDRPEREPRQERNEREPRQERFPRRERFEDRTQRFENNEQRPQRFEQPEGVMEGRSERQDRFQRPQNPRAHAPRFERPYQRPPVEETDEAGQLPAFLVNPVRNIPAPQPEPAPVSTGTEEEAPRPRRGRRRVVRVEAEGVDVPTAE